MSEDEPDEEPEEGFKVMAHFMHNVASNNVHSHEVERALYERLSIKVQPTRKIM